MIKTCITTGAIISEQQHILQSIKLILTTPIGTLPYQRDFGCSIWQYLDAPLTTETIHRMHIGVMNAIDTWEPRVKPKKVTIDTSNGKIIVKLSIEYQNKTLLTEVQL